MHVIAQIGQWLNVLFAYGRTQEKPLCRHQQIGYEKKWFDSFSQQTFQGEEPSLKP